MAKKSKKQNNKNYKRESKPLIDSKIKLFIVFVFMALVLNKFISLGPRGKKLKEYQEKPAIEDKLEKKTKKLGAQLREGEEVLAHPDNILVLVNKDRALPEDYEPGDLVVPDINFLFEEESPKKYLRQEAASHMEELFQAAQEAGLELYASSGYRAYETQKYVYDSKLKKDGRAEADRLVSRPGHSEHQTGLAMDLTSREIKFQLDQAFEDTKEGKWIKDQAHKYGFILRYPKEAEAITKYKYEPWHIRYVGREAAREIYENGLTLEEYMLD